MNIPDELLTAYVDGELKGAERARVEQAIAQDARVAQRVAQYRATRGRLRGVFDGALHEPVPQRLLQVARSASRPSSAQVIDLARVRAERKRRNEHQRVLSPFRIAFAACLLGGLLVGAVAERLLSGDGLTEYRDGALFAGGALADALSNQLTNRPAPGADFHVGLSFRAKSGSYCRTFSASGRHALAGLACHEQDDWRILTLVSAPPNAAGAADAGAHRVASSASPLLLQMVRERIAGEPLDEAAEVRARGSDWR
ncbi:MAG TPA: zf-HC2 domain-containing protein [Steroidobacteraceae bacterium]|nr:zf-HC2 domain-containing protein [Steroidobacteraceae bacterium]